MNKKETVHQVFGKFIAESDLVIIEKVFEPTSYKAGETIIPPERTENHFYLVESGIQMLYLTKKNGDKVVLGFSFNPSPTGVYDSFLKREPSKVFFETITETSLWRVSYETFNSFKTIPGFLEWKTTFAEEVLFGRLQREVELTIFSAKERFEAFEKRMPRALQVVPQKLLASYLNMSPETFSRIRAERN